MREGNWTEKRDERRQEIINLLVEHHAFDLQGPATRFAVSSMTIRRDLDDLEASGMLRKVRGGATINAGTRFRSDFNAVVSDHPLPQDTVLALEGPRS
ncbi:DeoR/GlpR family transcriptional regulator of sugar metabolism [Rhizobium halophytocola]|uniref:DeoR/GlpR family transcriptional regulator of sugar metabolism n=1 Tax=Rhizobium halophytocola TaxID=735519 RepID=A0ABS4E0T2_9HYPH|nr:DeoR/GlpR family transcriptional regulator of sugar metabolism [Rhizobium halophytocola]